MLKKMKKFTGLCLAVIMVFSMTNSAFALTAQQTVIQGGYSGTHTLNVNGRTAKSELHMVGAAINTLTGRVTGAAFGSDGSALGSYDSGTITQLGARFDITKSQTYGSTIHHAVGYCYFMGTQHTPGLYTTN